jgi:L-histidine Nalpha-methyltransferase / hercynylcysteine S-oxide synthase
MHLETLLYMMAQSPRVVAPKGFMAPVDLFHRPLDSYIPPQPLPPATFIPVPHVKSNEITMGHHDEEADDEQRKKVDTHTFGWDNERPQRQVVVSEKDSKIQSRPVSVSEYAAFLKSLSNPSSFKDLFPSSWAESTISTEMWSVKTVFGLVDISRVPNWPVYVSGAQAAAYAEHYNLRLPREDELLRCRLPISASSNIAFRQWTPVSLTENQAGWTPANGWEWTSTIMDTHDGFVASALYP